MIWEPVARHRPSSKWTDGDLAAKIGADLGLVPDAEQQWLLDAIYAEREAGVPAAFEVAVVAPRQNLKSATLEIAALMDAFVLGVPLHIWTAHLQGTAQKAFQDIQRRINAHPDYARRAKFYAGHQDMSIHVDFDDPDVPTKVIEFQSRTGRANRGFTCDRLTLDEALYLQPSNMGAILPTLVTRKGAQVRYASSAGLLDSAVLRQIRDRGRSGKDPRLAYVEYGAPRRRCAHSECSHRFGEVDGCALDDRELWWHGNCALWAGRITEDGLEDQRRSLPPAEFVREFYSWWEDPVSAGGALPFVDWMELADPDAELGPELIFGLHVQEDRSAWITALWNRDDGAVNVILTNEGRYVPAHRVVEECKRLTGEHGGHVVPPKAFEADLIGAGVPVLAMAAGSWPGYCGGVVDAIQAKTVRHGNQAALNEAVRAAEWRSAGGQGERAFKDAPEIGPLAAMVRGLWGAGQLATYDPLLSVL